MRLILPASAMVLWLMPVGLSATAADIAAQAAGGGAPPAVLAAAADATAGAPDPGSSEAAARHARRAACLKEARAKKLVGAERNAFVKACTAGH